jgi:hypothetical protein
MYFQRNSCFKIVLLNLAVNLFLAIFPGSLLIQVCQRFTFYLYLPIPIHHHHLRIMLVLSISMDGKITFPRLLTSSSLKDLKIGEYTFYPGRNESSSFRMSTLTKKSKKEEVEQWNCFLFFILTLEYN